MKKKDNNDAQFVPTLQPFKGLKNKEKKNKFTRSRTENVS